MSEASNLHENKVTEIQRQIKYFYETKQKAKIYHGSSNSTRTFSSGNLKYVDVSRLTTVLEINTDENYAVVEPNVPLDKLVTETHKFGLVPPMVAEFPGITVGGAVQGGSGESSSFKYGTFDETCLEYEVVLGNGEVHTVSPSSNAELFYGLACSCGSLGVLTKLKIKLIPASTYVKITYYRTDNFEKSLAVISEQCANKVDFVDGILFDKTCGVVMVGTYTNERKLPVSRFSRLTDEWFAIHAENIVRTHDFYEELIPLKEYLFRYDRGAFWVAKYGFGKVPFNRLTRLLFAGLFSTRKLFKLLHASNYAYVYLAQDICLPEENTIDFLDFVHTEYAIYPLWLCPLKPASRSALSPTAIHTGLVINVGMWGAMKPSPLNFIERNRLIEKRVHELGGRKVLYAHAYYTENEFWDIYDRPSYEKLRGKYKATVVFPDVYQKTKTGPAMSRPSKKRGLKALIASPYRFK